MPPTKATSSSTARLTHGPGPGPAHGDVPAGATYLARSSGNASVWDSIAFIKLPEWIATLPQSAGPGPA
ncbi:hypothetical protein [Massilia eburnea]|uniref:hypothetical protein n=1 Tax=Massilia eburnea TaxID=1776165 RepID=UPI003D6A500D